MIGTDIEEILHLLRKVEEYEIRKEPVHKRKHFFYTIVNKLAKEGNTVSNAVLFLFYSCQKALQLISEDKFDKARQIIKDTLPELSGFEKDDKLITEMIYYSCGAYLDYREKDFLNAEVKIQITLDRIDKYYSDDPEMLLLMKGEHTLNLYRIAVESKNYEKAKILSKALIMAVLNFRSTRDIFEIRGIDHLNKSIDGYSQFRNNFLEFVIRKWLFLPESSKEDFISSVLLYFDGNIENLPFNFDIIQCLQIITKYNSDKAGFLILLHGFIKEGGLEKLPSSLTIILLDYFLLVVNKEWSNRYTDAWQDTADFLKRKQIDNRGVILKLP